MDEARGRKKKIVGIREYSKLKDRLLEKIRKSNIPFTYVVAVARGGLAIGERISRQCNIPLAIVAAENWPAGKKHDSVRFSRHCVYLAEKPKGPILIVDDLTETCATLNETKRYLHRKFAIPLAQMFTAVLLVKGTPLEMPNFIADRRRISLKTWVIFPAENPEIVI